MELDNRREVHNTADVVEDPMSECRSFGNNCQRFSQSRKISVGVLVNSVRNSQTKSISEEDIAENRTSSKGNCVKDHEGHPSITGKEVTHSPKVVSPWVSTRSFKPYASSAAVHDAYHTPNIPSKTRPRSKRSAKVSIAHSVQYFDSKTCDKKSNEGRHRNHGESVNVNNAEHVENLEFSTEPRVLPEKNLEADKVGITETGCNETLRMKLWEILGYVSPDKQPPGPTQLHQNLEMDRKDSPIGKTNKKSDTIESDFEKPDHNFKRSSTRALTRKIASTRKHQKEFGAKSSTCNRKEFLQKDIFSFRGEGPGTLYDTVIDGSLRYKRNRIEKETSAAEKLQGHIYENANKRQQSEIKSRSVSSVEKSNVQRTKVGKANSSRNRRSDVITKPKIGSKKNYLLEHPINPQTEQKMDVEIPNLKNQQEDRTNSMLENKMDSVNDPTTKSPVNSSPVSADAKTKNLHNQSHVDKMVDIDGVRSFKSLLNSKPSECKSNVQAGKRDPKDSLLTMLSFTMEEDSENRLSKSSSDASDSESSEDDSNIKETKKGNLHDESPLDIIIDTNGMQSFKNLLNSKSSKCKPNAQDGGGELKYCFRTKSRFAMEEDREDRLSKSSSDTTDSESPEDDSIDKGGREPEPLSTEIQVPDYLQRDCSRSLCNEKRVEMTESSPISESSREIEESSEHQAYLQQYQEDGLAGAVALLAVALNRVKAKLKSLSGIRSAEILRASAEEIFSQLQNAESQIKTDMGKLTSLSKLKRKRIDTRFQEQHDQLLGIFKKFKEEVDQHLNNCSIFDDLEEQEIELKGIVEKQRETHAKLLAQMELAIKVQLDDTESRIMAVQDVAREKMLQLKLVVAECAKTLSIWSN